MDEKKDSLPAKGVDIPSPVTTPPASSPRKVRFRRIALALLVLFTIHLFAKGRPGERHSSYLNRKFGKHGHGRKPLVGKEKEKLFL